MESQRSISQKIFIILIKLLEALSDNELNSTVDQLITNRIQTFQEVNGGNKTQPVEEESKTEENPVEINRNSVTLTITKMILFNMDKLLQVSLEVQKQYLQEINFQSKKETADLLAHKMQLILIDEDQLANFVKLLNKNEQNAEIVQKIYNILYNFVEISKSSSQAIQNISVLDMSKGLL